MILSYNPKDYAKQYKQDRADRRRRQNKISSDVEEWISKGNIVEIINPGVCSFNVEASKKIKI